MSQDKAEVYAAAYEYTMGETLSVAGNIPENKRLRVLQPGKAHPLWHMGHLAIGFDSYVCGMALGKTPVLPADYYQKFKSTEEGGDPISTNAADYPSWDQLLADYEKSGKNCVAALRELDDTDLAGGPKGSPPEAFADFFEPISVAIGGMADHDAYHRGQIGLLAALD